MPNSPIVRRLDTVEPELRLHLGKSPTGGFAAAGGLFPTRNSVKVLAEGEREPEMTAQSDALADFLNPTPWITPDTLASFNASGSPAATGGEPQVHTKETSEPSGLSSNFRDFAISGCLPQVAQARSVYDALPDALSSNRLHSFDTCRSFAWFVRNKNTGMVRVASSRCNLRWCPLCIKTRRYAITAAVEKWLKGRKRPKFLTLTLKHTESPLTQQIDNLYQFFKTFRRRPWFKKRLYGGIWFFQVKKSETDGLWHPHLHIVFDGRYLDHDELKQYWREITKVSSVVDIRAIKSVEKAAAYVARYAAAPCNLNDLDFDRALELVQALSGRRICGTFGSAVGLVLRPQKPDDFEDWVHIGSYASIVSDRLFDADANLIYLCWKSGIPCPYEPPEPSAKPNSLEEIEPYEPEPYKQFLLDFYDK